MFTAKKNNSYVLSAKLPDLSRLIISRLISLSKNFLNRNTDRSKQNGP